MQYRPRLLASITAALVLFAPSCSPGDDGGTGGADPETTAVRDRVAGLVAKTLYEQARQALAPLVEGDDAQVEDLLDAVVIELKDGQLDPAQVFLQRASTRSDEAAIHYLKGRIAELSGEPLETVIGHYRAALERAPEDPASKYQLASLLGSLDEFEEATALLHELEDVGIENGGAWYVSAVYQLSMLYMWTDDEAAAQTYGDLWQEIESRGLRALKEEELHEGQLARILPPPPVGNQPDMAPVTPAYEATETILPELAGGEELLALDLTGDRRIDLAVAGPEGVRIAPRSEDGSWRAVQSPFEGEARLMRAIDLGKDDSLDLLFVRGNDLALLESEGELGQETWSPTPLTLPSLPSAPTDLEVVDFDHDGDLDLFVVGDFGGRLLRNDGAGPRVDSEGTPQPRGGFVDATAEASLPTDGGWMWCAVEDLDGDQDVDLLMGGAGKLYVGSSLRAGRFEDVSGRILAGADLPEEPLLADFDGDARPDALVPGSPGSLWRQGPDGRFTREDLEVEVGANATDIDLDLDGSVDAIWATQSGLAAGVLAPGLEAARGIELSGAASTGPLASADLEWGYEDRMAWELFRVGAQGVVVHRTGSDLGHGMRVRFKGVKDNRQGIGAIVELRAGNLYRRDFWDGQTQLYGLGQSDYFDVVRVTWPNGVVQTELDVESGNQILAGEGFGLQVEGLVGSCPFLYTWNGSTFTFISDVLGITPLGLPMAPGMLVPPDHDEYVLVTGEQLVANEEGDLVLQFTEELREVTYLDRIRLDVVDHPIGTEVQPNERFCFPPFPEARTHVMAEPLAPVRVTGSDGNDWTEALASVDDRHARPFQPVQDGQFLGLAEEHWLELEFDPEDLPESGELRLVCTGWFYWTDASVNVAAARTPGLDFVPPMISIPADDDWRPIGPPVGFPAGKTKAMVIDATQWLSREDPRLRIGSTLRLYWDSIRLATGPDLEQRTTSIEAASARLWPRGFSAPIESEREDVPSRFDWEELTEHPRWDQHPGSYTRFGEVLALLGEVDDRMVVMGSGDCLTVTFDADSLPPVPEGWRRDYLVFLDGWAKDRDPNTVEALEVEPLPFHGMSGYPYGPEESFPDGPVHTRWRAEWQTRPAYRSIVPLSPEREREWLRERREYLLSR